MPADNIPEYSVSELSGQVKRTIEDAYGYVRVRGELGRVTRAGSGHVYLDLKDERACLSSVMWKGTAARQAVKPEQGMEVIATGRMSTFPGQSKYQLIVDTLAPAGAGALMALYEERKRQFAAEGLFDPARKRPLPRLPRIIGVVTSPSGAVIRDILHRLRDRFPSHVIVWPTLVQGEGAPAGIVRGIEGFARLPEGQRPDVLIVARGGGSLEDLWCFNDEAVVRAAAASPIPLISAVGHETDTTLIDYAADMRAPTPTAAAEMAVPVRSELMAQLGHLGGRLEQKTGAVFDNARLALRSAERGLGSPERLTAQAEQRLDTAENALARLSTHLVGACDSRLGRIAPRLQPSLLFRPVEKREGEVSRLGLGLAAAAGRQVDRAERRLNLGLQGFGPGILREHLAAAWQRLDQPGERLSRHARDRLGSLRQRLDQAALPRGLFNARLDERATRIEQAGRLLDSLSHKGVLARGFALVRDERGLLVKTVDAAAQASSLELTFADGSYTVTGHAPSPAKPRRKKPAGEQPKLF